MNVTEAIHTRRAIRSYLPREVDQAAVQTLLEAAVAAPTALNQQAWLFAVVQDRGLLRRWSDDAKRILLDQASADAKTRHYNPRLLDPEFNVFYDAGTLIVIGAPARQPYTDADCWLAAENLMLAACEAGLGSCPIGLAVSLLNTPAIKREMFFPEAGVAVAPIIVGYPNGQPPLIARQDPHVAAWIR